MLIGFVCHPLQNVAFDNSKALEFLRGNGPTWEIFRYNEMEPEMPDNLVNPLVKRDNTKPIIDQVFIIIHKYTLLWT
jgi:hypothetical protein